MLCIFNFDKLYQVAYQATINLNKVIDLNYYPTPETRKSNERHRPIGLVVQGLADTIMSASGAAAGLGSGLMVSMTDYKTLCHYVAFIGLVPVMGFLLLLFRTYKIRNAD